MCARSWSPVPTDQNAELSRAERLAALLDARLTPEERERLIHVLARSSTEREVLARVVLYLVDDPTCGPEP